MSSPSTGSALSSLVRVVSPKRSRVLPIWNSDDSLSAVPGLESEFDPGVGVEPESGPCALDDDDLFDQTYL